MSDEVRYERLLARFDTLLRERDDMLARINELERENDVSMLGRQALANDLRDARAELARLRGERRILVERAAREGVKAMSGLDWIMSPAGSVLVKNIADEVLAAIDAADAEREVPQGDYCDRCDGVGWYEGGRALQTECEVCGGSGIAPKADAEGK